MKLLIMCEGPNEREIIRILLENDMLVSHGITKVKKNHLRYELRLKTDEREAKKFPTH